MTEKPAPVVTFVRSPWPARAAWFTAALLLGVLCISLGAFLVSRDTRNVLTGTDLPAVESRRILITVIGWIPWLAVAVVIALRVWRGRKIRAGSFVLGSLLAPVLCVAWLLVGDQIVMRLWNARDFESAAWISKAEDPDDWRRTARLDMVDDLLDSDRLMGLDRTEVLALLGPPASPDFPFGASTCDMHWYLGPERGFFSLDSEWLFVTFGDDGRLDRAWLYRD